jgi:hypothetical protein
MNPHPREVVAKALLHILPHCRIQRPARASENAVYTGGRGSNITDRLTRVALNPQRPAADGRIRRRRQYLIGNAIRFSF